jgi:hypothetical protein
MLATGSIRAMPDDAGDISEGHAFVGGSVAEQWGRLLARTDTAGITIHPTDGLIAAAARAHRLQIVTRNVVYFQPAGIEILCPRQN